jgi:hypothetical protein
MVSGKGNVVYPNPNPHYGGSSPRSPTRGGGKEPLLKRLLGSITFSNNGERRERGRRRSSY